MESPPPAGHYEEGRFSALVHWLHLSDLKPTFPYIKAHYSVRASVAATLEEEVPRVSDSYLIQYMNNIRHNNLYIMRKRLTLLQ